MRGSGTGSVTGLTATACTADECTASLPADATVSLRAIADRHSRFTGWSDTACGTSETCSFAGSGTIVIAAHFELAHNVAFVTSQSFTPSVIGGFAGANRICAMAAADAGLPGLHYTAWLSGEGPTDDTTDDVNAGTSLASTSARGWVRPDGAPVADRIEELLARGPLYSLSIDENRKARSTQVFTATGANGTFRTADNQYPLSCDDWTGPAMYGTSSGSSYATGVEWTERSTVNCNSQLGLYCFGTDLSAPLPLATPTPGRVAFVTHEAVAASVGVQQMDATCEAEAASAGLDGRFRALVATRAESAASRFGLQGPTWVRTDGIAWLAQAIDLDNLRGTRASLNLDAHGLLVAGRERRAWTGVDASGAHDDFTTCTDWSRATGEGGAQGSIDFAGATSTYADGTVDCSYRLRLYCLQL